MSTRIIMKHNNIKTLAAKLYQKFDVANDACKQVIKDGAQEIMDKSLSEVPVDTGVLKSIGEVVTNEESEHRLTMSVGYGITKDKYNIFSKANASQYALKVHEDLTATHPNGGKAKYLEDPVNQMRQPIHDRLKEAGEVLKK